MKLKRIIFLALLWACPAFADSIVSPPPFGFDPHFASQSDFNTYSVPPPPIANTSALRAWSNAMNFFNIRAANVTITSGGAFAGIVGGGGGTVGSGSCNSNGTVCVGPCTFYGYISQSGTCSAVAGATACSGPGTYNSKGTCVANQTTSGGGTLCRTPNGGYSTTNSLGVCIVPGNSCTMPITGAAGFYNSSGTCEVIGSGCTTTLGLQGTLDGSGNCVATNGPCTLNGVPGTYAPSGSCIPTQTQSSTPPSTPPNSGYVTPSSFTKNNGPQWSGVRVYPTTPTQFLTSAFLMQFTVPSSTTSVINEAERIGIWVGTQPNSGASIAQVGIAANSPNYTWQFFYACNSAGLSNVINGITIHPNDTVFVEMWNTSPTQAYGSFTDITTGVTHVQAITCTGTPWVGQSFMFVVENANYATANYMPKFGTSTVTQTQAWSTVGSGASGPAPTSSQYVFEANAQSVPPTYQTFSGTFELDNMTAKSGQCCSVTTALSGTGGMTFTRSQTLN